MEANTKRLLDQLKRYGADIDGILDRFLGDMALYESCLALFLHDENFALLERSLAEKDYRLAFEAAHALKGVSANLGLTPFYAAICNIVEALRVESRDACDALYDRVRMEYAAVERLL